MWTFSQKPGIKEEHKSSNNLLQLKYFDKELLSKYLKSKKNSDKVHWPDIPSFQLVEAEIVEEDSLNDIKSISYTSSGIIGGEAGGTGSGIG